MSAGPLLRMLAGALLGVAAAVLVSSCGGSGTGLIPVGSAGPLQSDFEAVAQAAQNGDGNCAATEAAILKAEQDFGALPASVDNGLRDTLHQGIANLRGRALVLCAQPLAQTTVTTTTPKTIPSTPTPTTQTTTPLTTPTTTTPTQTPTGPTATSPGGGTPAPGAEAPPAQGGGTGAGESGSGGAGAGPSGEGSAGGNGVGAQEGGK